MGKVILSAPVEGRIAALAADKRAGAEVSLFAEPGDVSSPARLFGCVRGFGPVFLMSVPPNQAKVDEAMRAVREYFDRCVAALERSEVASA